MSAEPVVPGDWCGEKSRHAAHNWSKPVDVLYCPGIAPVARPALPAPPSESGLLDAARVVLSECGPYITPLNGAVERLRRAVEAPNDDAKEQGWKLYAGSIRAGEIIALLESVGADKMGHGNTVHGMVEALVERAALPAPEPPRVKP